MEANVATGRIEWREPSSATRRLVFTSDGRYLLIWQTGADREQFFLRDLVSGSKIELPFDFIPSVVHPRRLAVFGVSFARDAVVALDADGLHTWFVCGRSLVSGIDLALDGEKLLALCNSSEIVTIQSSSGSVLRTVSTTAREGSIVASHDGSRAVVTRGAASAFELALIDTTTGHTLGATTVPELVPETPFPIHNFAGLKLVGSTRDRRYVMVAGSWISSGFIPHTPWVGYRTAVLDFHTLTWVRNLDVLFHPVAIVVTPDNREVYATSSSQFSSGGAVQRLDFETGRELQRELLLAKELALAPRPVAPGPPEASIVGREVTLSWSLPGVSPAATAYIVEAGSAPGVTDLATLRLGAEPRLTVRNVPPGRYFVRVRAVNFTGESAPSEEIVFDVP